MPPTVELVTACALELADGSTLLVSTAGRVLGVLVPWTAYRPTAADQEGVISTYPPDPTPPREPAPPRVSVEATPPPIEPELLPQLAEATPEAPAPASGPGSKCREKRHLEVQAAEPIVEPAPEPIPATAPEPKSPPEASLEPKGAEIAPNPPVSPTPAPESESAPTSEAEGHAGDGAFLRRLIGLYPDEPVDAIRRRFRERTGRQPHWKAIAAAWAAAHPADAPIGPEPTAVATPPPETPAPGPTPPPPTRAPTRAPTWLAEAVKSREGDGTLIRHLIGQHPNDPAERIQERFRWQTGRVIALTRIRAYMARPGKGKGPGDPTPEEIAAETARLREQHLRQKAEGVAPATANGRMPYGARTAV